MTRIMLNVIVDLDSVPGVMHTPASARQAVDSILMTNIRHYNPVVIVAPENTFDMEPRLVFDHMNHNWQPNQEINLMFVRAQLNYMEDLLNSRGHLFLSELQDALGLPRTSAGIVSGWTKQHEFWYEISTDNGSSLFIDLRLGGNIVHDI